MNNKLNFAECFIGKYSISKTLRNELKPIGKTQYFIEENGIVTEDEVRADKYREVKDIIDDYHRYFLDKSLSNFGYDFSELFQLMELSRVNNDDDTKKKLEEKQKEIRKVIVACFKKHPEYKKLFKKEIITELLPQFIRNNSVYSDQDKNEKIEAVEWFDSFSTYFTNFSTNRMNIYSDEAKSTAVSYRLVNENANIFWDNINTYKRAIRDIGETVFNIDEINKELLDGWSIKDIYIAEYYSLLMIQSSIEFYNNVCGAFNSFINEYCQKNKLNKKLYKMKKLHKQILSISSSVFEIPSKFDCDEQVYKTINELIKKIKDRHLFERIINLFKNMDEYDLSKVYINNKSLAKISKSISGDWSLIRECLTKYYQETIPGTGEKKNSKVQVAVNGVKHMSLLEINELINKYSNDSEQRENISIMNCCVEILQFLKGKEVKEVVYDEKVKLIENEEKIEELKLVLDMLQDILHLIKPFSVDANLDRDVTMYSEYDEICYELEDVVPVYNKVRNYVTQKPFSEEKVKLNFGIPTLADGWDKNKEYSNNAMIFIRNGYYYLGIYNAKDKPAKTIMNGTIEPRNISDYKKMVYKLLPGPNKMLPKVFLSTKGIESYCPSEYILQGYTQGKHKKTDGSFDINFCRDLIDYFKESINKHPDWKEFGFEFSDTDKYSDISEFYREVAEQGYKITYEYISEEVINLLIDEGKMYFFQISNKDFAQGSKGKDNLHTMYWKNIFSEENLKDVVIKLNGQAELFHRRASILNPYIHKKGSILLNKTLADGTPIPDNLYQEIYEYLNDNEKQLSKAAEEIYPYIVKSTATMDIVKDRRYTQDKFFFHSPITLNFKATGKAKIDDIAREYIATNKEDMHFIGIDRGERNLLFVSVIDNKGVIKCQKSFNIINKYDYQEKLVQREKARDDARKSWKEIGRIKELKEGYLSQVIHEITKLMLEYNAVIVMENLNAGFKNSRKKVERQVYQKFEKMLIDKLMYLVIKEEKIDNAGGVLRGYQFTRPVESIEKVGKQCGMIFYVPPGYTSQIDPTTGFVNVFRFKKYSSTKMKKEFICKFDSIKYDTEKDMFEFELDYDMFSDLSQKLSKTKWKVYTNGERITKKWNKAISSYEEEKEPVRLTEMMKKTLEGAGIEYENGNNLVKYVSVLEERKDSEIIKDIFKVFELTMQMRNSRVNDKNYDKIISPVCNENGEFFVTSGDENDTLPSCADANGAYNIALKGLYIAEKITRQWAESGMLTKDVTSVTNVEWFEYIQNKRFK